MYLRKGRRRLPKIVARDCDCLVISIWYSCLLARLLSVDEHQADANDGDDNSHNKQPSMHSGPNPSFCGTLGRTIIFELKQ
ncbi:MAG: hypothetical protein WBM34_14400, partial [Woeseiaceae bacterium]